MCRADTPVLALLNETQSGDRYLGEGAQLDVVDPNVSGALLP
jgi:hypothetical protein